MKRAQDFDTATHERAVWGSVLLDPAAALAVIRKAKPMPPPTDPAAAAVARYVAAEQNAGRPVTPESIAVNAGLSPEDHSALLKAGEAVLPHEVEGHVRAVREGEALRRAVETLTRPDADAGFKLAEVTSLLSPLAGGDGVQTVDAASLLATDPPPPEYVLADAFEVGARVMLVGSSKTRKSFSALQLAVTVAAGVDFLGMAVPMARRVLLANLENPDAWQHRRLIGVCRALAIGAKAIGDRLHILNGRGRGLGLEAIEAAALRHRAEVVILDPLYKLDGGADECDQSERKRLVGELEAMGQRTGAALVFVHHDTKGRPGDRDIRDRGAGSNIINRDVDCTFALTPWGDDRDPDADRLAVLSVLSRNAPPHADRAILFDRGAFTEDGRAPCKATSKTAFGKRREPEGDPKADAKALSGYATKGDAKTLTELREHGTDTLGQRRARRALSELYGDPDRYGVTVHRDEKTGRGFIGRASAVGRKVERGCQVVRNPTDKPTS